MYRASSIPRYKSCCKWLFMIICQDIYYVEHSKAHGKLKWQLACNCPSISTSLRMISQKCENETWGQPRGFEGGGILLVGKSAVIQKKRLMSYMCSRTVLRGMTSFIHLLTCTYSLSHNIVQFLVLSISAFLFGNWYNKLVCDYLNIDRPTCIHSSVELKVNISYSIMLFLWKCLKPSLILKQYNFLKTPLLSLIDIDNKI